MSAFAVADLLGLVAFGELLAFERMAGDARLAPDLRRRAALSEMAAAEIANYRRLADRLTALGVSPEDAMAPHVEPVQAYHDSTEPRDWAEVVTKAYVGDAITDDFVREIAAERATLTALIARDGRVDVPGLFGRLTTAHAARMAAAGLNN
ncbi:ferritin-like fold-containing protein [Micromonospora ureilytica]|uniref:ferritin-like fold-containing protein n=1 Tax=Micromonospora ureilytica TaxID=709868 RepID=UPI002E115690|nr:ferritin-like domain-containing protein [Micromonospora ureilytica]